MAINSGPQKTEGVRGNTTYNLYVAASTLAAVPVTAPIPVIIGGATAAWECFAATASHYSFVIYCYIGCQ